ncbi:hypothetical protein COT75_05055 [Candidatus Beckwithbacteria bacterium CG10_big_fil_rev_8_21_14_0_10_34_10]|uniref:Rod shape-determining protein MreD n=1 Tax=Candidatus Beckwithbacteria bacterium CG10_big_fil_rev_8_21_14_0_10_34_10 TaxID=1974495 RepID=A0A2H0WA72_9BACT|nr:MAG: hypothetical protein COT75_05055 [Candidatus Beckwithbacteria bacterium CG10_big_fil_rev_8_21_14_0_10_34_10]
MKKEILNPNNKKIFFIILLSLLAIAERLWFNLGPNVELITLTTILSAIIFRRKSVIIVPLIILSLTDLNLKNTNIMIFTWSAFVLESLAFLPLLKKTKFLNKPIFKQILFSSFFGAGASLWFFLWTNLGFFLTEPWNLYPPTFKGLIACYVAGLPFLKPNLISNIFFLPLGIFVWNSLVKPSPSLSFDAKQKRVG